MTVRIAFGDAALNATVVVKKVYYSGNYHDKTAMYREMKTTFMGQWPGMQVTDTEVFQAFFANRRAVVLAVFTDENPQALLITKRGDGSLVQTPENELPKDPVVTERRQEYISPESCTHHLLVGDQDPMAVAVSKIGKVTAIIEARHCPDCKGTPIKINAFTRQESVVKNEFLRGWEGLISRLAMQVVFG